MSAAPAPIDSGIKSSTGAATTTALDPSLPAHVAENRRHWDENADRWVAAGEKAWAAPDPYWGIWSLPESSLQLLPPSMEGMRAIELGCGTGYASGWMLRRGAAHVVGIDNSARQLETASRLATEHGVADRLTLVHGDAEKVTGQADGSFDFALSEYGAAIWCDPHVWIPEAHRLLKPGGRLVFLGNHPLVQLCVAEDGEMADTTLHRPYFGLHKMDWTDAPVDPGGVEFCLPFGQWLKLFRDTGFEVEELLEPPAPPEATGTEFYASAEWAKKWPCEHVWKLRKLP